MFPWTKESISDALNNGISNEEIDKAASVIRNKESNICAFVELLGPALTAKENDLRALGTQLLSSVVGKLINSFSDTELNVLCTFFIDRLNDHHSVVPFVITGLNALCKNKNLPDGNMSKIMVKFFQCVSCQSQKREDRAEIFELLKVVSETKIEEMQKMGPDWIYGVINSLDGERDPRNLLFIFQFMPQFLKVFQCGHLSEEMFEVFAVYFPVDFSPAPNDPAAITRDILAEHLSDCLCGSNDFADPCIDLLLEKLDSDLTTAKVDSYKLLIRCTKNFPQEIFDKHFEKLWNVLKTEVYPGKSSELTKLALGSISAIMSIVSDENRLTSIMTTIFTTTISSLSDIGSKLFDSSLNIALACMNSGPNVALYVASKLLPLFVSQMTTQENITQEQTIMLLDTIEKILNSCRLQNVTNQLSVDMKNLLQKEIVHIVFSNNDPTILKSALRTVSNIPELVTDENRLVLYTKIVQIVLEEKYDTLTDDICNVLIQFGRKFSKEMESLVLTTLKKSTPTSEKINERITHIFASLIFINEFKDIVITFLLESIFETSKNVLIKLETVRCLIETLSQKPDVKEIVLCLVDQYQLLEKIVKYVQAEIEISTDLIFELSRLIKILMTNLTSDMQQKIIFKYLPKMNLQKTSDLYITAGILGYMNQDVLLEDHFEPLVGELTKLSISTEDEKIKTLCNHLLCSLFNKFPNDDKHKNILKTILKIIENEIKLHKKQAVEVLSWISKGLVTRGHEQAAEVIDTLAELLDHPTLSEAAVLAFEVLSLEDPQLHLPQIKHLFKQKIFVYLLKKLESKIEKLSESHMSALIFVMKITPHVVLKMNIEKLKPVLLKSLNLTQPKALIATLNIIKRFLDEKEECFNNLIPSLVQQLLKLTQFKTSMNVRISALECLNSLSQFPTFLILPYKHDVIFGIATALDDPKRLVRNIAVNTRLHWFLIGAPNDDDDNNK